MTEVHVIFPPNSSDPIVTHGSEALTDTEPIYWHVVSRNTSVDTVVISFYDPTAKFFNGQSSITTPKLNYTNGQADRIVYGAAPSLGMSRFQARYGVEGKDAKGQRVAYVDPEIIITRPGP